MHGTRPVAALLEVHRELSGNLLGALTVNGHAAFGYSLMNQRTAHSGNQAVRHLEIKDVDKTIPRSNRSVRQFDQRCGRKQAMTSREFLTVAFNPLGRHVKSSGDRHR